MVKSSEAYNQHAARLCALSGFFLPSIEVLKKRQKQV